jgi:hypothetical protein
MLDECKYGAIGGARITLPCYYRHAMAGIKKEQSTKS